MNRPTLGALAALLALASSCSTPAYENNHWHINNVPPRISYHFAGYRQSVDGPYGDRLRNDGQEVWLTLQRHFLNYDPHNPLLPVPTPKPYRPEPPNVEFQVKNP
jgi:hypothetical protein